MANKIKIKRGTNLSNITTAPEAGELIYKTDTNELFVGDGATAASALTAIGGGVDTSGTPVDNDFAKFTDANTIEGRSASETISDLGLGLLATRDTVGIEQFLAADIQTSSELVSPGFSNDDDSLMTAAAIDDLIVSKGYGTGTMSSWTLQGDSGANRSVTDNNIVDIAGGTGISTEISLSAGVDIATINLDASINDLSDVVITSVSNGQVLKYSSQAGAFINQSDDTGISFSGSTANGLLTYGNSTTADVESGLTYDGSTLAVTGDQTISGVLKHSSNGDNRLTLDDDSDSAQLNQVTLASVNNVNILIDGTNNGTGDFQIRSSPTTANDLDTADIIVDIDETTATFDNITSQQFQIGSANRFKIQEEGAFVQSGSLGVGLTPIGSNSRIQAYSHIEAGVGSGAIGLTINDGGGNSNVTFNHTGKVPEQNGNSGRIEVNTDGIGAQYMAFELAGNVTSGVSVDTTEIARIDSTGLQSSLSGTAASPALRVNDSDTGLYRIADNKLGISTAGTFAVAVDASQNVGIGTSSPSAKLEVNGGLEISPAEPTITLNRNNGSYSWRIVNGAGTGSYPLSTFNIANNVGTPVITALDSGNVGIGVTDPSTKLEVAGPTRISGVGNALMFDTTGGEGSNFIKTINDYETVISNTRGAAGFGVFANSNIRLGFGTNYTFAETDLFINYTGEVGIGTTSPQGHLDINTENAEATQVYINGEVSQDKLLLIRHRENSEAAGALQYAGFIGSVVDNVLTLGHYNSSGSEVQVMHITEGGNVGIGTTSPSAKFEVVGGNLRWKSTDDANTAVQLYSSNGNRQLAFYGYLTSYSALQADNTSTFKIIQNNADGDIQFLVKPSSTGVQTEAIRIDGATANVGIGVASPEEKMHIFGDAPFLKIENNTEDASGIVMEDAQDSGQNSKILYDSGSNEFSIQVHSGTGYIMDSTRQSEFVRDVGYAQNTVLVIKSDDPDGDQGANSTADIDFHIWDSNTRLSTPQARIGVVGDGTPSQDSEAGGRLAFYTNVESYSSPSLTERMRIDSSGNVGIGTTSPSYKLEVNQDANVGGLKVTGGGGGAAIARFVRDVGGSAYVDIGCGSDDPQVMFTTSNAARQWAMGVDSSAHKFLISENSSIGTNDRFCIDDSGNVGIGTTSPATLLHINKSQFNPTSTSALPIGRFSGSYGGGLGFFDTKEAGMYAIDNGDTFNFYVGRTINTDTPASKIVMTMKSSGNVGIGTASPSSKLHVSGGDSRHSGGKLIYEAGGISDYFKIQRSSSSGRSQIQLANESGTELWRFGLTGGGSEDFAFWDGSFNHLTFDRSANSAEFGGSVGINVTPSGTSGRLDCSNDVVAFSTSDKRLKENIKPLDSALDKVLKISGVEFDWKELTEEEKKTIHGNEGHDVGVIAQEIEEVLPEVVTTRESGYKAVKYEKIVPLLIEAIKEQQKQINQLEEKLNG